MNLIDLGLNKNIEEFFKEYKDKYKLGRVAVEHKGLYRIFTEDGEIVGAISGKMKYNALVREDFPAVGDWVIIDRTNGYSGNAVIHGILPRKSKFSRKIAGNQLDEQIIAVNIDTVFICMSFNSDFNIRRLERYITMAWESGAMPVILLTKADLCDEIDEKLSQVEAASIGIDVHVISAIENIGMNEICQYIKRGETLAFLGSSGVGKSTIINSLLGEERQSTKEVRNDDKGKHTTTTREMFLLNSGAVVIDTPGMRELHILDTEEGLDKAFYDIEEIGNNCKFNDCTHNSEPDCAIKKAIEQGTLEQSRYNSYLKLKKEAEYIARKNDVKKQIEEKEKWKKIHKQVRANRSYLGNK